MLYLILRLWFGRTPACPTCGARAAQRRATPLADGSPEYGCLRCLTAYAVDQGRPFVVADRKPPAEDDRRKPDSAIDLRRDRDLDWQP